MQENEQHKRVMPYLQYKQTRLVQIIGVICEGVLCSKFLSTQILF